MTQDPSHPPEPNQPQPVEAPTEPLTDDTTLTGASLTDTSSAESQLQSTDSPAKESVTAAEISATEEPLGTVSVPPTSSPAASTSATEEKSSAAEAPASTSKATAFIRLIGQLWGIVLPILVIVARWLWQVFLVTLKWIREAWKVVLPKIRTLLPEGWRKLPDWVLTTVAVALLVFVLWLTVQLLPGKAPATAIDRPSPALNAPAPEQPTEVVPDPEQIAKIQEQVADVTDQYAEGLIQAVQANFQRNLLTVKLGDDWFNLAPSSQVQLANELLKRSHKLDFNTLEVTDAEGELLARSPVVGSKMVIYNATRLAN